MTVVSKGMKRQMKFDIRKNEFIDEVLYHGVHESGAEVYVMPKKGYDKCHAMFATRYGSLESKFEKGSEIVKIPDGTAHFLEHKLFEEEDGNVFDKFALLGASANAFTNFTTTAYYFNATSKFFESLKVLINFVQNPYFTKESVDKEQGIIGQEIKMYDDDPNWQVYFNLLGCLYKECYVKYDIAGTVESIAEINKDILYDIYSVFYHPSNMVLFIVGDVEVDDVDKCIEECLKKAEPLDAPVKRLYPKEPCEIASSYVHKKLDVAIPLFSLGFKDNQTDLTGKELLKKEIETKILLEMLFSKSSRIYKTLYEQGLINESFDADYDCHSEYAFIDISGESKEPLKVRDTIYDMIKMPLKPDDYERAKRIVWGNYVRMYNSTETIGYRYVLALMSGMNYFDFKDVYETITFEDILSRKEKNLDITKSALSVVDNNESGEGV